MALDGGHVELTRAEHRVAVCLLEGLTAAECAAQLGVAVATVRSHIAHLNRKFGTHAQHALVVAARRHVGCCISPERERGLPFDAAT